MSNETLTPAEETEAGWILQKQQAHALGIAGAGGMTEQQIDASIARLDELVPDLPDLEVS
jgi:hypothetical protein